MHIVNGRGCFSKKAKMSRKCSNSGDFRPPELRNDNRSRILTAKINLYGMSSFHFYRWNQLKLIPLPSALRRRTFLPPNVSLLIIGCVLRTMRYICNHQIAIWWLQIYRIVRYIVISQPRFERFWRNLARWRSSALVTVWSVTNLRSKEIQDGGSRHPNNLKITTSRQRFEQPSDFSVFT